MHFSLIRRTFAALLVAVLVSACGGGASAPPPAAGITVVPGDSQVTVSWTMEPGVQYWMFYAPAASISSTNWVTVPGARALINVTSPLVVSDVVNGYTYSFTLNARTGDGPGGAGTPSVSTIPRAGGATWTAGSAVGTTLRSMSYGLAADGVNYYVAVGDGGKVYKSITGQSDWTAAADAATTQLNTSLFYAGKIYALGNAGTLVTTTDFITWTPVTTGTTQNLNAIATSGSLFIAVGDNGTLLSSTDAATWTKVTLPVSQHLYGVAYSTGGLWTAVGANGTVLTSSDGATWTAAVTNTTANLRAITVQVTSIYTFLAVGDGGMALRSIDNGVTWTQPASGSTADLLAISPAAYQFMATGKGGTVLTSPDGITWTTRTTGSTADLYAVTHGVATTTSSAGVLSSYFQFVVGGSGGVTLNSR